MKLDPNSPFSDDTHFETEVRRLAGLIWPHGQVDRCPYIDGRERDAIVQTPDIVIVIEATTSRKKDKISDDAKKTNELVRRIRSQGFACRGILVTLNEPTADQESAAQKYPSSVVLQSFEQFLSRLFDAPEYLRVRETKPFGSIQNPRDVHHQLDRDFYIPIPIIDSNEGTAHSVEDIGALVVSGSRFVILGDFGSGKSMSLREVFYCLRHEFIKKRHSRFPVYINLRDHAGAKYPDEILERHARELGLRETNNLVKAWRAGFVDLLLDGFDEFAAVGWSSSPFKLRQLRRTILEAARRLITESSKNVGIIAVGRLHYFDSIREMQEALGLADSFHILRIESLSEEVALKLVKRYGGTSVPDWVPSRALLLSYLAATDFLEDLSGGFSRVSTRGHGWDVLLRMICKREAKQHTAIDEESVLMLIERLATIARRSDDGLGSFSEEDLSALFQETCGFSPDDAARVFISRLPGLANMAPESGRRRFIDPDIADAARAGDLFRFIESPYDADIQTAFREAQRAISQNGLDRLSHIAEREGMHPTKIEVAAEFAGKKNIQIAALDILQLMTEWNVDYKKSKITISDCQIDGMTFDDEIPDLCRVTFEECIVERLYVSANIASDRLPQFNKCLIGSLEGLVARGDLPAEAFYECEVLQLSSSTARNADILDTDLPVATKVLLTVLNKLFYQSGRGRKENAFYRGLTEPRARGLVPEILNLVQSWGFAAPNRIRNQSIWFPRRDKMRRVNDMISQPTSSTDPLIERIRNL